jgi:hypothetical protein
MLIAAGALVLLNALIVTRIQCLGFGRLTSYNDFPSSMSRFQHPRIWRGGSEGNCYIASSNDGLIVFFRYYRT